jgi:hypothetical protein
VDITDEYVRRRGDFFLRPLEPRSKPLSLSSVEQTKEPSAGVATQLPPSPIPSYLWRILREPIPQISKRTIASITYAYTDICSRLITVLPAYNSCLRCLHVILVAIYTLMSLILYIQYALR